MRQFNKVMKVIAFGRADWADPIAAAGGPISLCFSPTLNSFNGYETVDLQLIDWQAENVLSPVAVVGAMSTFIAIDAGTTNTRAWLVEAGQIVAFDSRPIGVRDTAKDGNNSQLQVAVRELVASVRGPVDRHASQLRG